MCAFSSWPRNSADDCSVTRFTQMSKMSTRSPWRRAGEASFCAMRAALIEASEKALEVVSDIDIEDPRAGEVLVKVSHCGVCHSDLSLTNGQFPVIAPTVLGHEAAGIVEAIGAGVTDLAIGDKVVLSPIAACNKCYWCVRGEYGCCVNNAASRDDGGAGRRSHAAVAERISRVARRRCRRLRRIRDHAGVSGGDQGGPPTRRSRSCA